MALNPHTFRPPAPQPVGLTARVVRSDASGVWVTPITEDQRHPIGPCYGAHRPTTGGVEQLPEGALVLLVLTAGGPWVAAHHQEA